MESVRKTYTLTGLDCPNCAEKISKKVNAHNGVKAAEAVYLKKELVVEYKEDINVTAAEKEIFKLVMRLEPGIEIGGAENVNKSRRLPRLDAIRIIAAAVLFGIGIAGISDLITAAVYIAAYAIIGYDIVFKAVRNIFGGEFFDENMLMSVATAGALAIGEYPEAVAVMLFFQVGELLQSISAERSRKSITELMNIRPDYASVKREGSTVSVNPENVAVGETIVVKTGERIPLDGIVTAGNADLDMSPLNGESAPRAVSVNDEVSGGALNINGILEISVTKPYGQSTVAKILELVENAASKKSKTEKFITRFSKLYTPIVVLAAVIVGLIIPLVFRLDFSDWIYRGLVFLIISCPCALVVSVPLGYFCGIGKASREGILIKGSNYFDALSDAGAVVFDKTGTLTKGSFIIKEVRTNGISEVELINIVSHAEFYSNHPLAQAVKSAVVIDESQILDYSETAGEGISVTIGGRKVLAGNKRLMKRHGIEFPEIGETLIYTAVDGEYKGAVIFADELKETSIAAVEAFKKAGIRKIAMLTGDNEGKAAAAAHLLGITEYYSELLPQGKAEKMDSLKKELHKNETLIFVGDGINDAPVLAMADVGLAMGGLGSDSAIEAADAVIMNDEPIKAWEAVELARRTKQKARQNIILAIGVKLAVQILSLFGLVGMWAAVCADVGVTLLAVLNAMRLLKREP